MNRREGKKLIAKVEGADGRFLVENGKWVGFELPDSLAHLKDTIIDNSAILNDILCPPVPRSTRRRKTCAICKTGSGCRRRAAILEPRPTCAHCGHWCKSHFLPTMGLDQTTKDRMIEMFPGGCNSWMTADGNACPCPGWPVPPPKPPRTKKTKKEQTMFLIPEEELRAAQQKYFAAQPPPAPKRKTDIEILCDAVRAAWPHQPWTIEELTEATEEIKPDAQKRRTWIRRTLRKAGIGHMVAPSPRTGGSNVHFSSQSDDWATPAATFAKLDAEFHFDLDVCASATNAKCANFFTKEMDGLQQSWEGVCWMNPPYGDQIRHWIRKAYESSLQGATVVCLIPSRTDTSYWHEYIVDKAEIRFVKGRLKFGDSQNSAPFPSAIVIFRPPNRGVTQGVNAIAPAIAGEDHGEEINQ